MAVDVNNDYKKVITIKHKAGIWKKGRGPFIPWSKCASAGNKGHWGQVTESLNHIGTSINIPRTLAMH